MVVVGGDVDGNGAPGVYHSCALGRFYEVHEEAGEDGCVGLEKVEAGGGLHLLYRERAKFRFKGRLWLQLA